MNKITCEDFIISHIKTNKNLSKLYSIKHPNSKYTLKSIINDIIYVLKTGISWRSIRSSNNWQSIYFHFKRFSKTNIFRSLFNSVKNKYIRQNNIDTIVIDSSFIPNKNYKILKRNNYSVNIKKNKKILVLLNYLINDLIN